MLAYRFWLAPVLEFSPRPPPTSGAARIALAWVYAHTGRSRGAPQVTSFFVAGIESQGEHAETAYGELRERSRIVVGCPARPRRIFKLSCRFEGHDCEIEVGRPLVKGGDVVVAILDHGRFEPFCVHTADGGFGIPARVKHPVYSVTEFS